MSSLVARLYRFDPCINLPDKRVSQFIGVPFLYLSCMPSLFGEVHGTRIKKLVKCPTRRAGLPLGGLVVIKSIMFLTEKWVLLYTIPYQLTVASPIDMNDPEQYLRAVDVVLQCGVPNYRGVSFL